MDKMYRLFLKETPVDQIKAKAYLNQHRIDFKKCTTKIDIYIDIEKNAYFLKKT